MFYVYIYNTYNFPSHFTFPSYFSSQQTPVSSQLPVQRLSKNLSKSPQTFADPKSANFTARLSGSNKMFSSEVFLLMWIWDEMAMKLMPMSWGVSFQLTSGKKIMTADVKTPSPDPPQKRNEILSTRNNHIPPKKWQTFGKLDLK